MKKSIVLSVAALIISATSAALALDGAALTGKWQLVEVAKDPAGKPCPFVGQRIEFTPDGKMISANMPVPFRYKVNPTKAETEGALTKNPELQGMELMLAMVNPSQTDWSKAPIVYGVELKGAQLTMKVSGYTPARYQKQK